MIVIRQKEFNSKAQKARRRVYDLQQGSSAKYAYVKHPFDITSNEELLANAQSQDKMIGRKKTMDLIKKGEKSAVIEVNNKKELDEINRARDLLRAGRDRNSDRIFKGVYEGKKDNINDIINKKAYKRARGLDAYAGKLDRKNAVEQSKITNPQRVKESIAKHEAKAAELRAKKKLVKNLKTAGKVGLGIAGAAGIGYGIKKAIDKKKKDKK